MFQKADTLIGVSNHNCDKLVSIGAPKKKVRVLHNGTRLGKFSYSSPRRRFKGETVKVLFVGRLVKVKSPLNLLDAFAVAKDQMDDISDLHLTIAGDGPELSSVQQRIQYWELQDKVECLGRVSHDKVQSLMKRHHIYAQHSKKTDSGAEEGLGVVFVEAQASGLPAVATQSGGISDIIIDGETGYLVPEGDTEAMADRIVHLAKHPEMWEKMGQAGRRHVEENFELTTQVEKLIALYKDIHGVSVAESSHDSC